MLLIVDFGSQTTHLIGRRLRELGAAITILPPEKALAAITKEEPKGIILSGGPSSVYEKGAPQIDKKIFALGIPLLGICYGMQLTSKLLGGTVVSGKKEYGPATLHMKDRAWPIAKDLPTESTIWMSHGDEVIAMPDGFDTLGSTDHVPFAFVANMKKQIFGVQFHPEVDHTEYGSQILKNFLSLCNVAIQEHTLDPALLEASIRETVGDSYVIGAVSGGVDSTVAGVLAAKSLGDKFIPIFVDNGLMRDGTRQDVEKIFNGVQIKPIIVNVEKEMLKRLKGVTDPEKKRKIIGGFFIDVFEQEMQRLVKSGKDVTFLLQGTIYSDVIESKGTKHADKIKSHHNVGGLPKHMKLKLLEPLRDLYKDEVRKLGTLLKIPDEFVHKQKFPGPGYGVRIRGEVTKERLEQVKIADDITLEELQKANLLHTVFHSFPVMSGAYSTAVKGDGRVFEEVIALRITTSSDEMTFGWAHLPYETLQKISSRIINEVPNISRVLYDITTKPPATVEWE